MIESEMMMSENEQHWLDDVYRWLLLLVSGFALLSALGYWAELVGLVGSQSRRFDNLPFNARMAVTTLAITLPFASLGLWFRSSWGVVVWLACVVLQTIMYSYWSDIVGYNAFLLATNFVAIIALGGCIAHQAVRAWRKRLAGY